MAVRSATDIIADDLVRAVNTLASCVTPLFDVNNRLHAELLGSGSLISVFDDVYLCTAEHVLDAAINSEIYFDGPQKLEILSKDFYIAAGHDVAVMKLNNQQLSLFCAKYSPIKLDDIASVAQTSASVAFGFVGYPASKNKRRFGFNIIKRGKYAMYAKKISVTDYNIELSFKLSKNVLASDRSLVTSPNLFGMSGGGMFGTQIADDAISGSIRPRLVGISTCCTKQTVIGSTIAVALAVIRDQWGVKFPTLKAPNAVNITVKKK